MTFRIRNSKHCPTNTSICFAINLVKLCAPKTLLFAADPRNVNGFSICLRCYYYFLQVKEFSLQESHILCINV